MNTMGHGVFALAACLASVAVATEPDTPAPGADDACLAQAEPTNAAESSVGPELVCGAHADCVLVPNCCGCPSELRPMNQAAAAEAEERCARRHCGSCDLPPRPQPESARCVDNRCEAAFVAPSPPAGPTFVYDATSGRCIDGGGHDGMNPADLEAIAATGNADCVDLSGRDLQDDGLVLVLSLNFGDWSLRGANLRSTVFPAYGAPSWGASLQGADLRGARDAYGVHVQGVIDEHTRYDEACAVTPHDDGQRHIDCPPPRPR